MMLSFYSVFAALLPATFAADYSNMEGVFPLASSNFNSSIREGSWLILFYRKSCGGCQRYSTFFGTAANYFKKWQPLLLIGAIDCEDSANSNVCADFNIAGVPTLRYLPSDPKLRNTNPIGIAVDTTKDLELLRNVLRSHLLKDLSVNTPMKFEHKLSLIRDDTGPIKLQPNASTKSSEGPSSPYAILHPVYADDIFKSLSMLLSSDVAMINTIRDKAMLALKEFLSMLIQVLPCTQNYRQKLTELYNQISPKESITGKQWSALLKQVQFPLFEKEFVACNGSRPHYRGYPCGLWVLFHTLTVEHYNRNQQDPKLPGDLVAHALNRFVPNFFSCLECSFHFAANTANIAREGEPFLPNRNKPNENLFKWDPNIRLSLPKAPQTAYDEVIWLNRVHNRVNKRLSGSITEDPTAPKIQFPSRDQCPLCWSQTPEGNWTLGGTAQAESKLFQFLVKRYDSRNFAVINVNNTFFDKFPPELDEW